MKQSRAIGHTAHCSVSELSISANHAPHRTPRFSQPEQETLRKSERLIEGFVSNGLFVRRCHFEGLDLT